NKVKLYFMLGLPTETEDDFRDTISLLEHCQYDSVFTFIYSKRNGTKAATMDGQVDIDTIDKRFKVLLEVVKKMSFDRCESMIGKTYEAMVERIDSDIIETRLSNNLLVHLKRENDSLGDMINVRLIKNHNFYFDGERV
ncbi:MAG: tRNA (N6-isopentenyl adenosine(37)-C2)-methylthiotransferase MiaB, partial [Lachnospiraceae bacterium]|nr:tRNA (N6-isopentenyl adenosine(37)-C2)-methylthiotransferase MiaB [Lachnospiraceae bacterium]